MKNSKKKKKGQIRLTDKTNNNVICFVLTEVILCQ